MSETAGGFSTSNMLVDVPEVATCTICSSVDSENTAQMSVAAAKEPFEDNSNFSMANALPFSMRASLTSVGQ